MFPNLWANFLSSLFDGCLDEVAIIFLNMILIDDDDDDDREVNELASSFWWDVPITSTVSPPITFHSIKESKCRHLENIFNFGG